MTEISTPNTDRILREHEEWQKRYTGLPINFIEEIENAKIKELREIASKIEDAIDKQTEVLDTMNSSGDRLASLIHDTNRRLTVATILLAAIAVGQFLV